MAIYSILADILEYPGRSSAESLDDCVTQLAPESSEASAHLIEFQRAIARKSLGQLQEVYTNAFDLRPDCTPNLGYHLFGDDGRRGLFLAELKERMESRGIQLGTELPDHIALVLRYVDIAEEERLPIIEDCLLPAVSRMAEVLQRADNAYEYVLRALLSLIRQQYGEGFTMPEPVVAFNILE